jgi:hypothetical protein
MEQGEVPGPGGADSPGHATAVFRAPLGPEAHSSDPEPPTRRSGIAPRSRGRRERGTRARPEQPLGAERGGPGEPFPRPLGSAAPESAAPVGSGIESIDWEANLSPRSDDLEDHWTSGLIRQMILRSQRRLNRSPALARAPWLDSEDWTLHQRMIVKRHELTEEVCRLRKYLRRCQLRHETPRKELLAHFWDRIAEEGHELYVVASMGADPRRLARLSKNRPPPSLLEEVSSASDPG